jgi:hypothetical protein
VPTFTYQERTLQKHHHGTTTADPANMWSDSYALPSAASGYGEIHRNPSNAKTEKSDGRDRPLDILQPLTTESGPTRRARHAVYKRHSKARESSQISYRNSSANEADTQAAEKKQRHREKNKVAAAKHLVRQRKQVQTMQARYEVLSEANTTLESHVQELRRELNGLRACVPGRADCDYPTYQYNWGQRKRVIAERYPSK